MNRKRIKNHTEHQTTAAVVIYFSQKYFHQSWKIDFLRKLQQTEEQENREWKGKKKLKPKQIQ
jgi:hypothetical protein